MSHNKTKSAAKREHKGDVIENRRYIESLKCRADRKRSLSERVADWINETFGTMTFLLINVVVFSVWLVLNTGLVPGVTPFDPFPFGLLTTVVSLEAIILAIFVLISQNRAAKVADLREEVDLQLDMIAEEEITKLLKMVSLLLEKQGIDMSQDKDLPAMLEPTNIEKLEDILEEQVGKAASEAMPL